MSSYLYSKSQGPLWMRWVCNLKTSKHSYGYDKSCQGLCEINVRQLNKSMLKCRQDLELEQRAKKS